jgi:tetratricopeptide (TPR) repeat protein
VFDDKKEFTNWDDDAYVTNQPLVKSLEKENIKTMFKTESRVAANYHPLTMLSLAVDYARGDGKMAPFVQTNLLLHVINTALVFFFVMMLMRGNLLMSALAAAFFGVHPMHVESVAWIAERKDVLYTLFFLLSLMSYVKYMRAGSFLWLVGAFAAFVVSCYSKPMAVTLPVVLFLLDIYERRAFSVRTIAEKVPFLVVSMIFGLLTLKVQSSTFQGLVDTETYSFFERAGFAAYGTANYIVKLFVPTGLSAVYPYPPGSAIGKLSAGVLLCLLGVAGGLITLVLRAWKDRSNTTLWTVFFGVMFFFVTISIVLQFISVGGAVMADRYTYVPYIGLFIALGAIIERFTQAPSAQKIAMGAIALVTLVYAGVTYARVGVWRDSGTLWTDVIEKYPYVIDAAGNITSKGINHAYNNRAVYYMTKGDNIQAERDYSLLKRIGTNKSYTYKGFGALLQRQGRHKEAIEEFTTALRLGGDDTQVYRARGFSYMSTQQPERAAEDLRKVYNATPQDAQAMMMYFESLINLQRHQELLEVTQTLSFPGPAQANIHIARGVALGQLNRHLDAMKEFELAVSADPNSRSAQNNLAIARKEAGR